MVEKLKLEVDSLYFTLPPSRGLPGNSLQGRRLISLIL